MIEGFQRGIKNVVVKRKEINKKVKPIKIIEKESKEFKLVS